MKRIAVFCDGTWNSPTIAQPTHVYQLSKAVDQSQGQVALYLSGLGLKPENGGFLDGVLNKFGGGAFGWGLNDKIKAAYAELARRYEPGDEIMIFGFSRGAYTARSLGGMIRKCGFPDQVTPSTLKAAFRLYKKSGARNAPDEPHILAERQKFSPRFATSQKDLEHRGGNAALVRISYMGIWDTVGALGIPVAIFGPVAKLWNHRHQFHDTDLSSMVQSARHAVAIDEWRSTFEVTPWSNLDHLRDQNGTTVGVGLNRGDTSPDRPFQQLWFAGDHSMVGGTGALRGLTSITLAWIAEGAQKAGLILRDDPPWLDAAPEPLQEGAEQHDRELIRRLAPSLLRPRQLLYADVDISPTVRERMDGISGYRPQTLGPFFPDMF